MAIGTLYLDEVTRSRVVEQGSLIEVSRGFTVEDMDVSLPPAALMIEARSVDGMPTYGQPHPHYPIAKLIRKEFFGNTQNGVAGQLIYSSDLGIAESELTITVDTRTVTVASDTMPDGDVIRVYFEGDEDTPTITEDTIPSAFRRPCTAIIVEGTNFGNPNYPAEAYVGYVLADEFRGRPAGSWLVDGFSSVWAVYKGTTTWRAVLLGAPGGKKWWATGILTNSAGKKVYYSGIQDDIKSAISKPYAYGEQAPAGKGFSVYGGYETVDSSVLGLP